MTNATALCGPAVVVSQSLFQEEQTALEKLGTVIHSNDGRKFRYAKTGAVALVAGTLLQAPAEDVSNMELITVTAPSAGDTQLVSTSTVTLALNALAGGLLVIAEASTGKGQVLRIAGNTAASGAVTTISLEDPVVYAATGTVKVSCHLNAYNGVIINPTSATSAPVGVAMINSQVGWHSWIQVCGQGAVLNDAGGAITVGTDVVPSTSVAGAVKALTSTLPRVGTALNAIGASDVGLAQLTLA